MVTAKKAASEYKPVELGEPVALDKGDYDAKLAALRALGSAPAPVPAPAPVAEELLEDPEQPAVGAAVFEEEAAPPPVAAAVPALPSASEVTAQILAGLKAAGRPVDEPLLRASVENMMANATSGVLDEPVDLGKIVETAVRLQARNAAVLSPDQDPTSQTRSKIMAEPRVPWMDTRPHEVQINGWRMKVPANRNVLVPRSVYEVLVHAVEQERSAAGMQEQMRVRLTGMPQENQFTELLEGTNEHMMRPVQ